MNHSRMSAESTAMNVHIPQSSPPYSTNRAEELLIGGRSKRFLDVSIALAALIMLAPLFIFLLLLIWYVDGVAPVYRHRRIGARGVPFDCFKLRTMKRNADQMLTIYLMQNPAAAHEWRETRKLKHDPRITRIGLWLRLTSLDELPQLINVLRGDMSLVGPRPIVEEELSRYGAKAEIYFRARPGLTGLWQISGRNDMDYADRVRLDCQYVHDWSLAQDLVILARTVPAVVHARGSY